MRDIVTNLKATLAQASGAITGTGTGTIIDTQGFHSVMFAILIGTVSAADASNFLAITVQEGDSALGYDMAEVAATRLIAAPTLDDTADAQSVAKIGVTVGIKRYMRLSWTETGTFSAVLGAIAILGHPEDAPVA